jgi:hypothetical protein
VALQRKIVKPDEYATRREIHAQTPEIAKESRPRGVSGMQTLYMIGRMKIDQKDTRGREPVHRSAQGLRIDGPY